MSRFQKKKEKKKKMKTLQYKEIIKDLPPKLSKSDIVAIDLELAGLKESQLHRPAGKFVSLACSFDGETAYIIFDDREIPEFLERISDALWVFHNSTFDIGHLRRWAEVKERPIRDTMLIEKILWSNYYDSFGLNDLVRRYLKCYMSKSTRKEFKDLEGEMTKEQIEYAALDVIGTWLVNEEQQKVMDETDEIIWSGMYMPHVWTVLELGGFTLDINEWKSLTEVYRKTADEIREELGTKHGNAIKVMRGRGKNRKEVDEFVPFNPASPTQVKSVLAQMGIVLDSTDDDHLSPYYDENEFARKILDFRRAEKQVSTYGLDFLKYVEEDGKIYTSLNIGHAETGRDSSSSPNLQNIPKEKCRRKCFTARDGFVLTIYDYSGQEANIWTEISGDSLFREIINSGKKLYIEVARLAFDEVVDKGSERYDIIKALVLGMMYGLTPYGFARDNKVDLEIAEEMYNKVFKAFPITAKYIDSQQSYNRGIVKTILGRKIHLHPYSWQWKNNALNSPMQGTGGDMIKLAMKKLRQTEFYKKYYPLGRVRIILQVHDEIITEVSDELAEEWDKIHRDTMIAVAEKIHPSVVGNVSGGIIRNWAEK